MDETDATVETEEKYHHTDAAGAQRRTAGGGMESELAGVSLDTDTAFNSQENSEYMIDEDSQFNGEMDEPLNHFFTRCEEDNLTPCKNVGIETNSTLHHELHRVSEGKPLWQQDAT